MRERREWKIGKISKTVLLITASMFLVISGCWSNQSTSAPSGPIRVRIGPTKR